MKKKVKLTPAEQRKKLRDAAMPEVKKLVAKHGRSIVASCLNQLRDYEKKLRQLASAEAEVAALRRQI